jgi:nitroreductase
MSAIDLYEAMSATWAVRRLRPDLIPDQVLRRVLEAAAWAPSGGNRQAWRIIAVKDPDTKRGLRDLYRGPSTAYAKARISALEALPEEEREAGSARMPRATTSGQTRSR